MATRNLYITKTNHHNWFHFLMNQNVHLVKRKETKNNSNNNENTHSLVAHAFRVAFDGWCVCFFSVAWIEQRKLWKSSAIFKRLMCARALWRELNMFTTSYPCVCVYFRMTIFGTTAHCTHCQTFYHRI